MLSIDTSQPLTQKTHSSPSQEIVGQWAGTRSFIRGVVAVVVFVLGAVALGWLYLMDHNVDLEKIGWFGRPPADHVEAAVRNFHREYFLCGDAIDLKNYKVTGDSKERMRERDVMLYELRVRGVFNKDYRRPEKDGKLISERWTQYRKGDELVESGRLIFWREGSRWYCTNPDTFGFSSTLYWSDH